MAEVPVTINAVIVDYYGRTIMGPVKIVGNASLTGLGVGGGPMPPGEGGGDPPGFWGGSGEGFPTHPGPLPPTGIWPSPGHPAHPIAPGGRPPGTWGGAGEGFPTPPIYLPPEQVPPNMKPPQAPPPGTTAPVPGNWPSTGMVPPEYVVFNYPGVGPIYVAPPPHAEPAQS